MKITPDGATSGEGYKAKVHRFALADIKQPTGLTCRLFISFHQELISLRRQPAAASRTTQPNAVFLPVHLHFLPAGEAG